MLAFKDYREMVPDVVFMAGMKHCGKTTHGRLLAQHWDCAWSDSDDLITEAWAAQHGDGRSIRDIFRELGADGFAELEAKTFQAHTDGFSQRPGREVVSLGGRLPCNPGVSHVLRDMGLFVYLRGDPALLFRRVMGGGCPPFLDAEDPEASFMRLLEEREPVYLRFADVVVDVKDLPVDVMSARIISIIEETVDAR